MDHLQFSMEHDSNQLYQNDPSLSPLLPFSFPPLFPSFSAPHIQLRETEVELQRLHNRIAEDRYEGGDGGQWMKTGGSGRGEKPE